MKIEIETEFDIPESTPQQRGMSSAGNYPRQGLRYARAAWQALLEKYAPVKPMDGPVALTINLFYHTSDKKKGGTWKTTRPDSTNLLKLIEDAMTRCGYWKDDSQVCCSYINRAWTLGGSQVRIYVDNI